MLRDRPVALVHIAGMCGRYGLGTPGRIASLPLDRAIVEAALLAEPRWNIAPSSLVHAVVSGRDGAEAAQLKWGLIPFWAKDASIGNKLANARSDSVRSKPSFRRAFAAQRALVFADLFYEWQAVPGERRKQPWCIRLNDNAPFAFAAIWDRWSAPGSDADPVHSCALITTDANALMTPIHHRMPVIVPPDVYDTWLDTNTPLDDVESLLVPYPDSAMQAFAVSTRVNSPANDDIGCVEPLSKIE